MFERRKHRQAAIAAARAWRSEARVYGEFSAQLDKARQRQDIAIGMHQVWFGFSGNVPQIPAMALLSVDRFSIFYYAVHGQFGDKLGRWTFGAELREPTLENGFLRYPVGLISIEPPEAEPPWIASFIFNNHLTAWTIQMARYAHEHGVEAAYQHVTAVVEEHASRKPEPAG